jgi:hypothetical protein
MSRRRNPFFLQSDLMLILHRESGSPYALRLDLRKLATILVSFGFALLACFCGTLLFFRELEINRQLLDRALDAEVRGKLLAAGIAAPKVVSPGKTTTDKATTVPGANAAAKAPVEDEEAVPAPKVAETVPAKTDAREPPEVQRVGTRVAELLVECTGETCTVDLSLLPTSPGVAKGQLLLVLETEIPRIGSGDPSSPMRKRYYLYPGYTTRDELAPEALTTVEAKPFHFSRGLHTRATFTLGKLLRPLAINAYLFDVDKNLLSHERKAVETDE